MTKSDIWVDPGMPDFVQEDIGCSQYKPTNGDSPSNIKKLCTWAEPQLLELPWILQARLEGLKLKDIARELDCSIPTAHRRVKAAIEEVRLCERL